MLVFSAPYPASAGISATKWRINISAAVNAGSWPSISEIEMAATIGGADQCNGGTASASAQDATNTAAKAFDNNFSTQWQAGTGTTPVQIQYDFGTPTIVREVRISHPLSNTGDGIKNFTIEYWDGALWIVAKTVTGVTWASISSGAAKSFPIGSTLTTSDQWRLIIDSVQTTGAWVRATELEFRQTSGGANQATGGLAFASSANGSATAAAAFDSNTTTNWQPTGTSINEYIGYNFAAYKDITEISWRNGGTAGDSPTQFRVQRHNSETYEDVWTVTTPGTWSTNETRVFTKP